MSEWIETKLSTLVATNIASIGSDYPFAEIMYLDTGSITRGKIDGYQKLQLNEAPSRARRLVKENDIIYSTVRPIQRHFGFITSPAENLVVSTGFTVVSCNQEKLNPKYLYYYLASDQIVEELDIIAEASTSTYPSLKPSDIESLELRLPKDTKEQKAIASVLSSLDDKIDLLHRQNKTLETMAETLFRQWFVEEAQEDWEEGRLGDVIEIFDSQRIPLSKMERDKKKDGVLYPYYGAAQIMDYVNDFLFEGEYILLGEDGTVRTNEGYPVLQYATGKFWVNNHAHVLRAKAPYSNFLIWNYLSKKNIDEIVTGAVQPKINQANLKSLGFPQLPEKLIHEFNSTTAPMLEKIHINNNQATVLEKLRDTLLPKLMSGEVRVDYAQQGH